MGNATGKTLFNFVAFGETDPLTLLDAYGASSPSAPAQVVALTDNPDGGATNDQRWLLTYEFAQGSNIGTIAIVDGNPANVEGPTVLQVINDGGTLRGGVKGRTIAPSTAWNLVVTDATVFTTASLRVCLLQGGNWLAYPEPPTNQSKTLADDQVGEGYYWGLAPVGGPNSGWLTTQVSVNGDTYVVSDMLEAMWSATFAASPTFGEGWGTTFAPYLLFWTYEFPQIYGKSVWKDAAKTYLYDPLYYPYFLQNPVTPGWGEGDPPTQALPQPR